MQFSVLVTFGDDVGNSWGLWFLFHIVIVEGVGHAGGDGPDGGALRDHSELHEEHAGAHRPALLVPVHAVRYGS